MLFWSFGQPKLIDFSDKQIVSEVPKTTLRLNDYSSQKICYTHDSLQQKDTD